MSKIKMGSQVRIATVRRTGKKYIVQQMDVNSGNVYCWPAVEGFGFGSKGDEVRVLAASIVLSRGDVSFEDRALCTASLNTLFEQRRKERSPELMSGELEVKRTRSRVSFAASPSKAHSTMTCPCHNVPLRHRHGKTGEFFGCGSFGETGCKVTWTQRDGWKHVPDVQDCAAQ